MASRVHQLGLTDLIEVCISLWKAECWGESLDAAEGFSLDEGSNWGLAEVEGSN